MGIGGLLKGLQFCTEKGHIKDFKGQSLAVDCSSWLHKSVYSISEHYVEAYERNHIDAKCVNTSANYIFKRCEELFRFAEIHQIFLVMDGKRCPLKAVTNDDRERRRYSNLKDARDYKRQGKHDKSQEKYKACIKIGTDLTNKVIRCVQRRFQQSKMAVHIVWSPYEADAQLVKLCMEGQTTAIVTEDSDVLVYLAACHVSLPVLFKLDRGTGACDILSMDWLLNGGASRQKTNKYADRQGKNKNPGIEQFADAFVLRQSKFPGKGVRMFIQACVLAGCDYCPNMLSGIGLVTAFKLVCENASRLDRGKNVFQGILASLPKKAKKSINIEDYELLLSKSEAVFYHHPVRGKDFRVRPILSLNGGNQGARQFLPSLCRFNGDWSFLGEMDDLGDSTSNGAPLRSDSVTPFNNSCPAPPQSQPSVSSHSHYSIDSKNPPPVAEVLVPNDRDLKCQLPQNNYDASDQAVSDVLQMNQPVVNPYQRRPRVTAAPKESARESKQPTLVANHFAQYACPGKENVKKTNGVRFVKRNFNKDETGKKPILPSKRLATTTLTTNNFSWKEPLQLERQSHFFTKRTAPPAPVDCNGTAGLPLHPIARDSLTSRQQFDYGSDSDGSVSATSLNPCALAVTGKPKKRAKSNGTPERDRDIGALKPFKRDSSSQSQSTEDLEEPSEFPVNSYAGHGHEIFRQPNMATSKFFERGKQQSRRVTLESPFSVGNDAYGRTSTDDPIDLSADSFGGAGNCVDSPVKFDYGFIPPHKSDNAAGGTWGSPIEEVDSPGNFRSTFSQPNCRHASTSLPYQNSSRLTKAPREPPRHHSGLREREPLVEAFQKQQESTGSVVPASSMGRGGLSNHFPHSRAAERQRSALSSKQKVINNFFAPRRNPLQIMTYERFNDDDSF